MNVLTGEKKSARKSIFGAVISAAFLAAGCVSPVAGPSGQYAKPIGNAPVTANPTPYSDGLVCMGHYARQSGYRAPRIAVGRILDYTGKADLEGGRRVTQGASLMAISAFAKSGARLVERFDTSVSELELKYANNKLIGDEQPDNFRKITAGSIPGSDFYLVGGITELNYNIRSNGVDLVGGDPAQGAGVCRGFGHRRRMVPESRRACGAPTVVRTASQGGRASGLVFSAPA